MDIMAMVEQLSGGFLVTVEIFALTLLFSLPLGMLVAFGRMSRCNERNPSDAADHCCLLWTLLYVSIENGNWIPFPSSYHCVCD